ncbi:MAG TPA: hypothetical protein VI685_29370 [Candidatus Angelobacter sp.]
MSRYKSVKLRTVLCISLAVLCHTRIALGQQQNVPMWTSHTTGYTMVGTDPSLGAAKTKVPVALIPVKIKFPADGTILNPNATACGGTDTPLNIIINSPLFQQAYDFTADSFDLGTTQYTDAFQRANFWTTLTTVSLDYHVLLKPLTVEPVQTLRMDPPAHIFQTTPCPLGVVLKSTFDTDVQGLLQTLGIPPTTLAVFLTYDTTFSTDSGGSEGGYHGVTSTNQTYVVASFTDLNALPGNGDDVAMMSHELAEWMDDPLANNMVPGWMLPGGSCNSLLEVGDRQRGVTFTVPLNGFNYHLQDLAFLSWFTRESPSSAVNQWYSFKNILQGVSSC